MDLNDKLSTHFSLRELVRSDTATRLGIDNTPDEETIECLRFVSSQLLEPVREHFGVPFSPNSGFRCLELNRALKSKDTSQHIKGEAVDIEVPGVSNFDLADWLRGNVEFDQLILEFYTVGDPWSGWVHVSARASENRGQVLTIGPGGTSQGLSR